MNLHAERLKDGSKVVVNGDSSPPLAITDNSF